MFHIGRKGWFIILLDYYHLSRVTALVQLSRTVLHVPLYHFLGVVGQLKKLDLRFFICIDWSLGFCGAPLFQLWLLQHHLFDLDKEELSQNVEFVKKTCFHFGGREPANLRTDFMGLDLDLCNVTGSEVSAWCLPPKKWDVKKRHTYILCLVFMSPINFRCSWL